MDNPPFFFLAKPLVFYASNTHSSMKKIQLTISCRPTDFKKGMLALMFFSHFGNHLVRLGIFEICDRAEGQLHGLRAR